MMTTGTPASAARFTHAVMVWLCCGASTMPLAPVATRRSTMRICSIASRSRSGPSKMMRTRTPSSASRSAAQRSAPRRTDCQCSCVSPFGMTTTVYCGFGPPHPNASGSAAARR